MRRPLCFACLCIVAIAALRLWLAHEVLLPAEKFQTENLSMENPPPEDGELVTVTGRVSHRDTQSFSIDSVLVNFKDSNLSFAVDSQQKFSSNIQQTEENTVKIGSVVTVRGKYRYFQAATNPGEFDRREYYASLGISGELTDAEVLSCGRDYSYVKEALFSVRCYFKERLYHVFPEKEASVLTAMLLGDKENLNAEVKKLYQRNGVIHILSISGLHISLIGMGIYRALRKAGLPIWMAAILGSIVLVLYGVMSGMGVSACRAIGMYLIRMLAEIAGRTYDMLTALGVTAVILIWRNPAYLGHAGFLLSFGSVLGIGVLYPRLFGICPRNAMLQSVLAGTSITLTTLPVQLWFYYEIPVYSILLNLPVVPFVGVIVVSGMITMLLPGTGVLGTLTCFILKGYEVLCEAFEQLPFHLWNPGRPTMWQVVVYYLILAVVCIVADIVKKKLEMMGETSNQMEKKLKAEEGVQQNKQQERLPRIRRISIAGLVMLVIFAVFCLTVHFHGGSTVTFLDVGQGDCILVETEDEVYLFDCGSSSRRNVGEYVLIPYLKYCGIQEIDAVFVSHTDIDHCNGVLELLEIGEQEGITVGQLVLSEIAEEKMEEEFAEILEIVEKEQSQGRGIQHLSKPTISYIQAGDYFEGKKVSLTCLHPPRGYDARVSNAYSECFYVKFAGGASMLLTGDAEGEGEDLLIRELRKRKIENVTILKVAHHGSYASTSEALLEQIQPMVSIVSCGRNNRYGHPHAETMERLEKSGTQIFQTQESGAITVRIKEKKIRIEEFISQQSVSPHS